MDNSSATKLKVVGVGGAGGNAINDMIQSDITDVEFIAINTDKQDLDKSLTQNRILLGKGQGAGADPEKGKNAAKESEEKIKESLKDTDMLFITAGMGGGTGTGAAPVIAEIAKEMGILTVAVVTKPFIFEGILKEKNAKLGIENLQKHVDTLIVIPNQKLYDLPDLKMTLANAFKEANNVLKIGIKGISDLITKEGFINIDFADAKTIMKDSGIGMLGFGEATGNGKAKMAIEQALSSPLLENSIEGARKILMNITASEDLGLDEIGEISTIATQSSNNPDASLIWGVILDPELEDVVKVSIVATDYDSTTNTNTSDNFGNGFTVTQGNSSSSNEGKLLDDTSKEDSFVVPPFFKED